MFARSSISAAVSAATAAVVQANSGKDKIEVRLHSLLTNAGCDDATLDKLGDAGLKTISIFTSIADSKEKFRELLDSDDVGLKATDLPSKLQQAAIMCVYKACLSHEEVEVRLATQRKMDRQPPTVSDDDIDVCWKLFELQFFRLNKAICPSPDYLGRKEGEVESSWKAEALTRVTTTSRTSSTSRFT